MFRAKMSRLHRVISWFSTCGLSSLFMTTDDGWPLGTIPRVISLVGALLVVILLVASLKVTIVSRVRMPVMSRLRRLGVLTVGSGPTGLRKKRKL